MPEINSFIIDTSDLAAAKTTRRFSISGDKESKFILQAVNDSGAFYNWKTKTFTAGHVSENNLVKTLRVNTYSGNIIFPSSTTTTYNVILIASPDSDTVFSEDISGGGKNVLNKAISQVNDVNVVFAVSTANTQSYGDPTTPATLESPPAVSVTSTASPTQTGATTVSNEWTVYNRDTDTYGFGLRLIRQPKETDWYTTVDLRVDQPIDTGSTTEVVLDALTDLAVGMVVTAGTGLSGTPQIVSIDEASKTLTLSTNQNFNDNVTLTFQARGAARIKASTGMDITFGAEATAAEHSITVRANDTDETIPIKDTYGVSGGIDLRLEGAGINTGATNVVTVVTTPDTDGSGDGVITMTLSSTVTTGTVLYLDIAPEGGTGSTTQIGVSFTNIISAYPSANRTIYLNLDNFITPGVSGA